MPTAATTGGGTRNGNGNGNGRGNGDKNAPRAVVPFIRASAEHVEPSGIDVTRTMTANGQNLGVFDVPAYGYVRSLYILVEATGSDDASTGGSDAALAEDGPFNVLQDVALTEPNGAVIAQFNSGYEVYLANKWGGYRKNSDPKLAPNYTANSGDDGDFSFGFRIPIELSGRDGLGSLPNQNAAATFKLRLNMAGSGTVYSSAPGDTLPDVRVRVFLEAWDQPESSMAGAANQTTPPAMNTTQFWSSQVYNVSSGEQTIRLTRVGNYIRNLVFILRDDESTPVRSGGETEWPDPVRLYLDTRPVLSLADSYWDHVMYERSGFGDVSLAKDDAGGLDSGVRVLDMTHEFDGTLGYENRDLWLPTIGSTRLEVQGNFGGSGTLTVLTNDVAIAGPVFL